MGQTEKLDGGCLCGAVRFSATPDNRHFGACHCDMCRRWTAGSFYATACGSTVEIHGESSIGIYASSDWAERHFCKQCGTSLWYKLKSTGEHYVSIEAFDDSEGFELVRQIYIDEKPTYYALFNETQNMTAAQAEAAFAPSNRGNKNVGS